MDKKYLVVVQCDIVKERCSGYFCEYAFSHREDRFQAYSKERELRLLTMTCDGCSGSAVQRKLEHFIKKVKVKESIEKDEIAVHLASCVTNHNHHGPPCPHLDYMTTLIEDRLKLEIRYGTKISKLAEKRRQAEIYGN